MFNFVIFVDVVRSGIRDPGSSGIQDPGWIKIRIRDKHLGSATLLGFPVSSLLC
jgi:hypothetical protein